MLSRMIRRMLMVLVIVLLIAGYWQAEVAHGSVIGMPVRIYIFLENAQSLGTATIAIPLPETDINPWDVTVFFDVNGDRSFSAEEKGVDGVPALAEEGAHTSFPIEFTDASLMETFLGDSRRILVRIEVRDTLGVLVDTRDVGARRIDWEINGIFSQEPGFVGGVGGSVVSAPAGALAAAVLFQGATVQQFNKDVPDLPARKGKKNECVALSIANSLLWLAKKNNFGNKLPGNVNDLLDEINTDVKYVKDKGANPADIQPGKEKLIQDRQLPVTSTKIDTPINVNTNTSNVWQKMVEELQKGEDVELVMEFKPNSQSDQVSGSHAVTVVGASSKGNKKYITVHDSVTPKDLNDTYEVSGDGQIKNYPTGKGFGVFIISESFARPT